MAEGADATYTISLTGSGVGTGPFILQNGETASIVIAQTDGPADATTSADYDAFLTELGSIAAGRADLTLVGNVLTYTGDGAAAMTNIVVNITAIEDSLVEGPENYTVTLSTPGTTTNADIQLDAGNASVQTAIADNDLATWSITGDTNVAEGADATYTISLTGSGVGTGQFILQNGETASIVIAQTDGPADATTSADYDAFLTELGSIAAGRADLALVGNVLTYTGDGAAAMTSIVVNITAIEDSLVEGPENYTVTLSTPGTTTNADIQLDAGNASVQTAIADNDLATWSITGDTNVAEGADATYTISLTGSGVGTGPFILQNGETASIVIAQTDGPADATTSADYDAFLTELGLIAASRADLALVGNVLTYTGDGTAAMADIVVDITAIEDSLVEGPENYTVTLSTPGTTTNANIQLDAGNSSVVTAIADNDLATWSIAGDTNVNEGADATYTISLTGSGVGTGPFILQNGETASIQLAQTDGPPAVTTAADYDSFLAAVGVIAAGRADLALVGNVLTYTGDGATAMADIVVDLTATEDSLVEGPENFTVTLSTPGTTTNANIQLGTASVETEIADNDFATWSISSNLATVVEGNDVTYTIELDGDGVGTGPFILQVGETATIDLSQIDGPVPLTDSADYDSFLAAVGVVAAGRADLDLTGSTLTYTGDGATAMADVVVMLTAIDDSLIEGTENFTLVLDNAGTTTGADIRVDEDAPTSGQDSVETEITDNDTANWTLVQTTPTSIAEGADATYVLTLDGSASGMPGPAAVQTGDNASITLALGLVAPTSLNDFDEESDQSLNETNPLAEAVQDAVEVYNFAAVGNATPVSGTPNTFELNPTTGEVTFYGDSLATAPALTINLTTFDDDDGSPAGLRQGSGAQTHLGNFVEPDEDFTISIADPQFNQATAPEVTAAGPNTVSTTIIDDNTLEITIVQKRDAQEGDDGDLTNEAIINGQFEILLSNPSQNTITVSLTDGVGNPLVNNGTADNSGLTPVGGNDYQNSSLSNVTFSAGDQSEIASVDVVDDMVIEGTETVVATLTNFAVAPHFPSGATLDSGDVIIGSTNEAELDIIDDDSAALIVGDAMVNEDTGTVTVTVTLDKAVQNGFTVPYSFTDVTADGGSGLPDDYNNATGVLTFVGTVGEVQNIVIPIFVDDVVEPDETFTVGLGAIVPGVNNNGVPPNPIATVNPSQVDVSDTGTVTIVNDDTDISITAGPDAVADEGNSGTTAYTFTVSRVGLTTGTTTATWTVSGSGANPADAADFGGSFPTGTVTFLPGSTSETITVLVSGDTDVELDENFTVTLTAPADTLASTTQIEPNATADGTIVNDDIDISITADASAVADEGNAGTTAYTFTATRAGDTTGTTTATWTVSGSGANPADAADFGGSFPTGTVTFAPGSTSETITVLVSGDTDVEMDENFTVTLSAPADSQAAHIVEIEPNATADGTIVNDDIDISITADASAVADEGNAGTTAYTFTATRAGDTTGTTTATWTVSGSGANPADAADFGGSFPTGTVTFAPGSTSETITVLVSGDTDVELDENFTVTLTAPADDQAAHIVEIDPNATADGTIVNDDIDISITADASAVADEGNAGTTAYTFTATRAGDTTGTTTATWTVSGSGANPADAADFGGGFPTGTVTFAPGSTSETITVLVSGDTDVELDENFTVTLTAPADDQAAHIVELSPNATADGTIVNDDIDISIAPAAAVVAEGSAGTTPYTFTVTRAGDTTGTTTATWTVSGSGANPADAADFGGSFPTGTVTFLPGSTTETITVLVSGDTDVEPDENFTVTLTSPADDQVAHIVEISPNASADGTIVNDDSELSIADAAPADEQNDLQTQTFNFVVTRAGDLSSPATVDYVVGGADVDGNDFVGGSLPGGTVSFAIGQSTATINVSVNGDNDVEADEDFTVTLSNASVTSGSVTIADGVADSTIVNDDIDLSIAPGVELYENDDDVGVTPAVPAGFTAYDFVLTRSGDLAGTTTATYSVTGTGSDPADAADFGGTLPTGTVTFLPTETTTTLRILVSEDSDVEGDEDFTVSLSNPADTQANHIVEFIPDPSAPGSSAALGFIVDGDTFSQPFTITNSSGAGVNVVSFTLDISATGQEYDTNSGTGVPFTPVAATATATGLVGPVSVPDGATTFTLNFTDFDSGESFQWDIDVDTVGQNNGVDGNELIGATATIAFDDGNTLTGILEAVPGNTDAAQFNVTGVSLQVASATATILNDDIDLAIVASPDSPQIEGNAGSTTYSFEITRDGFITNSTEDTTVDWTVSGIGLNPANAADFVGGVFPSGSVTFGPNEISKTITVDVLGDNIAEVDESFVVTLSNAQNADANLDSLDLATATQSAVIINDDTANVSVVDNNGAAPGDVVVNEPDAGDPNTLATFTIELDKPADQTITIDVTTSDGTAMVVDNDYVTTTQTVVIPAGGLTGTFSVPVVGDNTVELDENFFVTLSEPTYNSDPGSADSLTGGPGSNLVPAVPQVEIVDATGEGIINNEDALIEFSAASSIKNEAGNVVVGENGPILIVRGDLTGTSIADRTVTLQRLGGTADRGNDFAFGNDPGQLLPASFVVPEGDYSGNTLATLGQFDLTLLDEDGNLAATSGKDPVLNVIDDSLIEGNESLTVELQGLGVGLQQGNADQGLGIPGSSTTTHDDTTHIIGDDDFATFTILPGQSVDEEGGTQPVTVEMTLSGTTATPASFIPGVNISLTAVDNLGGTADTPADYAFNPQVLTFTSADASGSTRTIDLTPASDLLVEGPETVDLGLNFNSASPFVVGGQVVLQNNTVQINDDDTANIGLTVASAVVDESAGTVTLNVQVDKAVPGGFVVDYSLADGSATNGAANDYGTGATTGTLNFTGTVGEIVPIVVAINEDVIVEGTEDFTVTLTGVTNNTAPSSFSAINPLSNMATVDITDNDGPATVSVVSQVVNESAGTVTVTVGLDKAVQGGFSVDVATGDDTAVAPGDYTAVPATTLNFAGTASETQTFTINIADDLVLEGTESLNAVLSNVTVPVGSAVNPTDIATIDGTIGITDNDGPATVSVVSQVVNESAGTVTVTVGLDKAVQGGFSVDVATGDDTAVAPGDYTAVPATTLNFAGTASETQTFTINIADDLVLEGTESLNAILSNVTVPVGSAVNPTDITTVDGTIGITDNDAPATVTVQSITVNENVGTATVDVVLDKAVQGGFAVTVATGDDSAVAPGDYMSTTATLNFAGTVGETLTFSVPIINDSIVETVESLNVQLSSVVPGGAVAAADINTVDGAITIALDDTAQVSLTPGVTTITESDVATYTLALSSGITSASPTIVDFGTLSTAAVKAIRDIDVAPFAPPHLLEDYTIWADDGAGTFAPVTGNQLTIPAGVNSVAVELRANDDLVVELTEEVDLQLTGSTGGAVASGEPGITLGTPLGGVTTITDSDSAQLIIKSTTPDAFEGGANGQFQVLMVVPGSVTPAQPLGIPAAAAFNVEVGYLISTFEAVNGVDYQSIDGDVNFGPGVTEIPIDIIAAVDGFEGDEDIVLTLDDQSEFSTVAAAPIGNVQVVVGDCDVATVTIQEEGATTASIEGRHIFYNSSAFDGSPAGNDGANDAAAIASDKQALLPGGVASFQNYTSYTRGINGIMVDVGDLPGSVTASDFEFKVGNDNSPASWAAISAASVLSVNTIPGAGDNGSDRVVIVFADNAIEKQWLQVTVKSNANTGLANPDVHYWGNWAGESGDNPLSTIVNINDALAAVSNPTSSGSPATVANDFDFNRDGIVNIADAFVSLQNPTNSSNFLELISPPAAVQASSAWSDQADAFFSADDDEDDWMDSSEGGLF